jgi:hypothetical protein
MWDELAAVSWIDPTLITRKETSYMSVDIDHEAPDSASPLSLIVFPDFIRTACQCCVLPPTWEQYGHLQCLAPGIQKRASGRSGDQWMIFTKSPSGQLPKPTKSAAASFHVSYRLLAL